MRRARAAFWVNLRSLWRDERGVSLVLTAIILTVLLAITGIAVDVGWWYTVHRQNQSAADAAALSAAYENFNNPNWSSSQLVPFATTAAGQNGYSGSSLTTSCSATSSRVCYPYSDGTVSSAVEVALYQPQNTWFASLTGLDSVTIANRAVAGTIILDSACAYVLNKTAPMALTIQGSGTLNASTCSICVDSNASNAVYMNGASNNLLEADALLINGEMATSGNPVIRLKHLWQTGYSGCTDPYAATLTHSFLTTGIPPTTCASTGNPTPNVTNTVTWYTYNGGCAYTNNSKTDPSFSQSYITLSADTVFENGLNIKGQTVNLSPGTYWIADGDLNIGSGATLECTGCTPGGAGVTIILTTTQSSGGTIGNISTDANATIDNLNAPGSGTFSNLLLIQDSNSLPSNTTYTSPNPCKTSCTTFLGGPNQTFTGIVYFPNSALNFQGNATTGNYSCLVTVANTLSIAGNSTNSTAPNLATSGCPTTGPGAVKQVKIVSLFE